MSSHAVHQFRSDALRATAHAPSGALATVVSICDSPAYARTVENRPNQPNADGLGCVRGVRAAFALEGGLALLLYGIWHLWHLVR